jgi:hypothetical protein
MTGIQKVQALKWFKSVNYNLYIFNSMIAVYSV